jgi:hypothetical protein
MTKKKKKKKIKMKIRSKWIIKLKLKIKKIKIKIKKFLNNNKLIYSCPKTYSKENVNLLLMFIVQNMILSKKQQKYLMDIDWFKELKIMMEQLKMDKLDKSFLKIMMLHGMI